MNELPGFLHRHAARLTAVALYGFARLPTLPQGERQSLALAFRFAFARIPLPAAEGDLGRQVREVHPDFQRISAWIFSVGAGVALNDLDGDGLPNDICLVDERIDSVIVAPPVPGTGERYPLFTLKAGPALFYNARTTAPVGYLPGHWTEDLLVYYWGRPPISFLRRGGMKVLAAAAYRAIAVAPARQIRNGDGDLAGELRIVSLLVRELAGTAALMVLVESAH